MNCTSLLVWLVVPADLVMCFRSLAAVHSCLFQLVAQLCAAVGSYFKHSSCQQQVGGGVVLFLITVKKLALVSG